METKEQRVTCPGSHSEKAEIGSEGAGPSGSRLVTQLCLSLTTPWSVARPPGSSVHGILQARTLQWVATPSARASSRPRKQADGFFINRATREPFLNLPLDFFGLAYLYPSFLYSSALFSYLYILDLSFVHRI